MVADVEEGKLDPQQPAKAKDVCFRGCSRLLNTGTAICAVLCIIACGLAVAVGPRNHVRPAVSPFEEFWAGTSAYCVLTAVACSVCKP